MGNKPSKEEETKPASQMSPSGQGKILNDTKEILLLHKSTVDQQKIVRHFRDALTTAANGGIHVKELVNIANGNEFSKDIHWLKEFNNIVLICLRCEAITDLEKTIRDKGFVDQNGRFHGKVFTISFGESLAPAWPPEGIASNSQDTRDFFFGFPDVEKIKPQDFERSEKMNALIAAIRGTN